MDTGYWILPTPSHRDHSFRVKSHRSSSAPSKSCIDSWANRGPSRINGLRRKPSTCSKSFPASSSKNTARYAEKEFANLPSFRRRTILATFQPNRNRPELRQLSNSCLGVPSSFPRVSEAKIQALSGMLSGSGAVTCSELTDGPIFTPAE